jgi:hypothetical protein
VVKLGFGNSISFHKLSEDELHLLCDALRIKVDNRLGRKDALRAVCAYLYSNEMHDFNVWLFPTLTAAAKMGTSATVLAALVQLEEYQFQTLEDRFIYLFHKV